MKYLVTGSAGFIGSRLMERLSDAKGWDKKTGKDIKNIGPHHCASMDRVIHLAAISGISECRANPIGCFEQNCLGTRKVLSAARGAKCPVVFASSAAAARPTNVYAASKAASEAWCEAYASDYGLDVAVLRLGNVYGPGSKDKTSVVAKMCRSALETGKIIVHGDGSQLRDFVHVDDVVEALVGAPPGFWSVRSGKQTKVINVAKIIQKLSGATIVKAPRLSGDAGLSCDTFAVLDLPTCDLGAGIAETWEYFVTQVKDRNQNAG